MKDTFTCRHCESLNLKMQKPKQIFVGRNLQGYCNKTTVYSVYDGDAEGDGLEQGAERGGRHHRGGDQVAK